MHTIKSYIYFNSNMKFLKTFKQFQRILNRPRIHQKFISTCITLSSKSVPAEKEYEVALSSSREENCDTFGNLQKSLEKLKVNPGKLRVLQNNSRQKLKKSYSDTFGNLFEKDPIWYPDILEEGKIENNEGDDSYMVKNISRKYRDPYVYLDRMKTLVEEKKLKDALDLFVEMKRNHVTPIHRQFVFMINACGKVGYTEMAFKLLRLMTDKKFQPTPATLTGLFNSCAECPFPDYGLRKANFLKEKIAQKNWKLTQITYHAMIKAFGKCGDIQTTFQIVDEMALANIKIDAETYNFLLMSCISDKEAGFTHAIEVFRKMKTKKCIPNEFSYNLLLRTARDCGIGPEEISCLLLEHWSNYLSRPYGFKSKEIETAKHNILLLPNVESNNSDEVISKSSDRNTHEDQDLKVPKIENKQNTFILKNSENQLRIPSSPPSILEERPQNSSDVLDLNSIKTSSDRLALIGGAEFFLQKMSKGGVKPTIKTFTLLLDCLPRYFEEEEKLITLFNTYNVLPDIGFCNILMKRRILRHENHAAKQVLLLIHQWGLFPDIITFGILAMGCRHYNQALIFLKDLNKLGFHPNVEITGALLSSACTVFDFNYLQHVLELMEKEDIKPNKKMLLKIEKCLNTTKRNLVDFERGKEVSEVFTQKDFSKMYKMFCEFYELWLKNMNLDIEKNVWSQYKTEIVEKNC